ncbi:helix-turn-helix domain-containing protein [Terrisporobacter vanillatitrophus]
MHLSQPALSKVIKNLELDQLNCSINCTKGRLVVGIPPVIGAVYFI